ncbi:hypothetical protein BDR04DRAFT_1235708 [Suillus decipiens]|nr:hypothetical protein BDR04DRAFT_1235708 [Suillus decipiens]
MNVCAHSFLLVCPSEHTQSCPSALIFKVRHCSLSHIHVSFFSFPFILTLPTNSFLCRRTCFHSRPLVLVSTHSFSTRASARQLVLVPDTSLVQPCCASIRVTIPRCHIASAGLSSALRKFVYYRLYLQSRIYCLSTRWEQGRTRSQSADYPLITL